MPLTRNIRSGKIAAISGTTITVRTELGDEYDVDTTSKAISLNGYQGMSLGDLKVGHTVRVGPRIEADDGIRMSFAVRGTNRTATTAEELATHLGNSSAGDTITIAAGTYTLASAFNVTVNNLLVRTSGYVKIDCTGISSDVPIEITDATGVVFDGTNGLEIYGPVASNKLIEHITTVNDADHKVDALYYRVYAHDSGADVFSMSPAGTTSGPVCQVRLIGCISKVPGGTANDQAATTHSQGRLVIQGGSYAAGSGAAISWQTTSDPLYVYDAAVTGVSAQHAILAKDVKRCRVIAAGTKVAVSAWGDVEDNYLTGGVLLNAAGQSILRNRIAKTGTGAFGIQVVAAADNAVVDSNLISGFTETNGSGIRIDSTATGCVAKNNTIYNCYRCFDVREDATLTSNISSVGSAQIIYTDSTVTSTYCVWHSGSLVGHSADATDTTADPEMIDPANGDFRLDEDSPARALASAATYAVNGLPTLVGAGAWGAW